MDVIIGRLRYIEVDNVSKCQDVDSAGGNIRCDENSVVAAFESGESRCALCLRAISMNPFRLDAAFYKLLGQAVRAVLGTREHQRLCHLATIEQGLQQLRFLLLCNRLDGRRDSARRQ